MQKVTDGLRLSASDLVGHLHCRHLTNLDLGAVHGGAQPPHFHDPLLEILIARGDRHEQEYLTHLRSQGHDVILIEGSGVTQALADQTLAAMKAGTAIIAQGVLLDGAWGGRADVLRRVDTPSALGHWSYDVIDTKLARETKGGTVLQLSLYSDLLSRLQGGLPESMHVVTPGSGFAPLSFRTTAFAAYFRYVKRRLELSLAPPNAAATYPDPKDYCDICRWRMTCDARRRLDDHLCLVAGITQIQIDELKCHDVGTMAKLAQVPLPLPWKPDRGAKPSYERAREQARVQVAGRDSQRPVHETLPLTAGLGLSRLPTPSPGDLFLDLEGDPFVGDGGLEYLFGCVSLDAQGKAIYTGDWAFTREGEKEAFIRFVDFVMQRWATHPDLHIYHYSAYEPSALKRLMCRYATREDEVDRMLRGQLFVDLYSIVRQSLRASVESYSLKALEPFYGYERSLPLADARRALASLQGCLELDDLAGITDDLRRVIAAYNRDDCLSTLKLRDWLETIRAALIETGANIPRPVAESPEPTEKTRQRQQRIADLVARLTHGIPIDPAERIKDDEAQARWMLAHNLDWHGRENKSVWWEYFRLAELSVEELLDERKAISGLSFIEPVPGGTAKAPIHRYRFPPQDVDIRAGADLRSLGGAKFGKVESLSLEHLTLDIKKRMDTVSVHPHAVYAHDFVSAEVMEAALLRIGESVAEHGLSHPGPYQAARDLLLRRLPQIGGEPLRKPDELGVDAAVRIAPHLAGGVLAIQGPPGAGKTYTGARMICALAQAGKRVGVTANSHKVIRKLLDEVVGAADTLGLDLQCIQKPDAPQDDVHRIRFTTDNEDILEAIGTTCPVAGGTAWLWSREDAFQAVDVLFVDEAAQMSLANVLAVSQACQTLVLLGDPQQLEQPMKGSHPEGTDVSALDHILAGSPTIDATKGLFLEETWRLHPDVCAFTSELFYEERLRAHAGLERQTIRSTSRIAGTGLRFLPVPHAGNQSSSPEEADRIRDLVNEVLGASSSWIDRDGPEKPVTLDDLLIIAPYNAQLFELQQRLPEASIGTVDKFQGQEAAIVIYSMTTSSHADAPRGMEFLYSLNRLNVATSRAKCVCVLVGSPRLFEPECRTPRQMQMANAFCRYLEMATLV